MNVRYMLVVSIASIMAMILLIDHLMGYYFIRPVQLVLLLIIYSSGFIVANRIKRFTKKITFCSLWLLIALQIVQLVFSNNYVFDAPIELLSWILHGGITIPVLLFFTKKILESKHRIRQGTQQEQI